MDRLYKSLLLVLILLSFQSIPMAPLNFFPELGPGQKSVEQYWDQSDLKESDLTQYLENQNCLSSQIQFLSCVNAINSVADRLGLFLQVNGALRPLQGNDFELRLTEKKGLEAWTDQFNTPEYSPEFTFLSLWDQLKSKLKPKESLLPLVAAGINGYLSVSEDPHTYIVPLAFYEDVLSRSESNQFSLGFVARRVKSGALVRKVFNNSPAARAGLRKGDQIKKLNGQEVSRLLQATYSEIIRGENQTRLLMEVERVESGKTVRKHIEVIKGSFEFSSVESRKVDLGRSLGLLTIHKFGKDTCSLTKKHLISLIEQSVEGILLDLRDNPGGQVDESACILNLFVQQGALLFETRYLEPTKQGEAYFASEEPIYLGPLAVLINAGSASASEIVAGVLKDLGRATLVGERSFGKGSFQDGNVWRHHQRVALFRTKGFYYFPSGWTPQLVGLEPDITVKSLDPEVMREKDLYFTPLRPKDLWNGPQTLGWLYQNRCLGQKSSDSAAFVGGSEVDPQIQVAGDWFSCELTARSGSANGQ